MNPIKVGLLGIGTVGSGTFNVLKRNQEEIRLRAGRGIEIAVVADLNTERARELTGGAVDVVSDANEVVTRPDIDIVVELIGGYGIARELVLKAIENGKHVVTANKALLAVHGNEIFEAARGHYTDQQLVETVIMVGFYFLIARMSTVFQLEIDPPDDSSVLDTIVDAYENETSRYQIPSS